MSQDVQFSEMLHPSGLIQQLNSQDYNGINKQ